jgi:hypothetical protein
MQLHVGPGQQQVTGVVASGFLRHCGRRTCRGSELGLIQQEPAPTHYYTMESRIQRWLSLVPLTDLPALTKEARDDYCPRPQPDPL